MTVSFYYEGRFGSRTGLTRRVPLVEQELLTLPEHMSSPPVFSGVCVTRSLVFVDRYLSFCTFSFGNCVVCSSSIYGFWLPLWYLQALFNSATHIEVPVPSHASGVTMYMYVTVSILHLLRFFV